MGIAREFAAKFYFTNELAELEAYKAKFGELEVESTEAVNKNFGEVSLADGTILSFEGDALTVGSTLYLGPEGSEELAPDGSHEAENGDMIITEGGIVIDIVVAEGEEAPAEEEASATPSSVKETVTVETNFQEEVVEETNVVEELLTALAPLHEGFEARFAAIEEALGLEKAKNEELTAQNKELEAKAEKFSKMPAAESHKVNKSAEKNTFKRYNGGTLAGKQGFRKI